MGLRGTDVAKQAADIVLTDDSLATLIAAVVEGRRVFDNIRRFVRYGVSGGLAEVAVMILGPLVGLGLPLLAGQILWINLLTHGLPGVAIGGEAAEADAATRPPRSPREPIVTRILAAEIALLAGAMTVASLALAGWGASAALQWQSMLFASLAFAQLGVAISTKSRLLPLWRLRWSTNRMLGYALASSALLTLAGLYVHAARRPAAHRAPVGRRARGRTPRRPGADDRLRDPQGVAPSPSRGRRVMTGTKHPAPSTAGSGGLEIRGCPSGTTTSRRCGPAPSRWRGAG